MNLNEQLQQAYNAGRWQGLNEQTMTPIVPQVPVPGVGPVPFISPVDTFKPLGRGRNPLLHRWFREYRKRQGLNWQDEFKGL